MDFETRNDVSEAEYMEMIRLKTSLLLACALKIGAQLAGASDEDAQHLYDFGEKMGLAFQLQDDLLDVYGDPAIFGKKIGGDIICNKKTFMLINALNKSNKEQREALDEWINKKEFNADEKIAAVTRIYDEIDIKTICKAKIDSLFAQSLASLEKVRVDENKKCALKEFATNLMGRKH
jgi:geranylgeranyl diphosphate synthase type II